MSARCASSSHGPCTRRPWWPTIAGGWVSVDPDGGQAWSSGLDPAFAVKGGEKRIQDLAAAFSENHGLRFRWRMVVPWTPGGDR